MFDCRRYAAKKLKNSLSKYFLKSRSRVSPITQIKRGKQAEEGVPGNKMKAKASTTQSGPGPAKPEPAEPGPGPGPGPTKPGPAEQQNFGKYVYFRKQKKTWKPVEVEE